MAPATLHRLFVQFLTPESVPAAVLSGRTKVSRHVVDAVRVEAHLRVVELERLGVRFTARGDTEFPGCLGRYSVMDFQRHDAVVSPLYGSW